MEKFSEQEASQLRKQIKLRKKVQSKSSIAKGGALKNTFSPATASHPRRSSRIAYISQWDPNEGQPSDSKRLLEIQRQIESVSALPKTSKYAQHRLKVLQTAQKLLEQG